MMNKTVNLVESHKMSFTNAVCVDVSYRQRQVVVEVLQSSAKASKIGCTAGNHLCG